MANYLKVTAAVQSAARGRGKLIMEDFTTLGGKIRRLRMQSRMTQGELAGSEFTKSFISQIEHDQAMPSIRTLQVLAARLNRPASYFLDESNSDSASHGNEIRNLCLAARNLMREGRSHEALTRLQTALETCGAQHGTYRAMVLQDRATVLSSLGDVEQALVALEEAAAEHQAAEDIEGRVPTLERLGNLHSEAGNHGQAAAVFDRALFIMEEIALDDPYRKVRLLTNNGLSCFQLDQLNTAQRLLDKAMELAGRIDDFYKWGEICDTLGIIHHARGQDGQALTYTRRALQFYETTGQHIRLADTRMHLGMLLAPVQGRPAARREVGQALALYQAMGSRTGEAKACAELGRMDRLDGAMQAALRWFEKALELAPDVSMRAQCHRNLSQVYADLHHWHRAISHSRQAVELLVTIDSGRELAVAYAELAELLQAAGEDVAAHEALIRSLEIFKAGV